ncbi:MAG: hypothetical protein M5T52_13000 [Ignavibacteriaceae bacterium]|nr:hypothetical protein [Ignavibacteriaceae bacterium]
MNGVQQTATGTYEGYGPESNFLNTKLTLILVIRVVLLLMNQQA